MYYPHLQKSEIISIDIHLPVLSGIPGLPRFSFSVSVSSWLSVLRSCAEAENVEHLRLQAATALHIAGPGLVQLASCDSHVILQTCLELLQDEQVETRNMAARFVLELVPEHKTRVCYMFLFVHIQLYSKIYIFLCMQ